MLNKIKQIRTALPYKNSENLGDFAILKSNIFNAKVAQY